MSHDLPGRVQRALATYLARHRERLAAVDPALLPVADAIRDFVLGGGKRLRPAFAYWGFLGAGGTDSDELVATLAALELVHASALIHDDVIDASDTRRGVPSVHRRFADLHTASGWAGDPAQFGRASAILLGDLCLVWSDELLSRSGLDAARLDRARPVFDEMRTEVTVGQYLDVHAQVTGDSSIERAGKVARYKSAKYTVERPLLLGAALAGATPAVCDAYRGYGLPLGEAFQLRDDVLGVYGDPARTGKPAGDDLREGKRTFLVAAALEGADPADGKVLLDGLGDSGLDESRVARLRGIIRDSGALARAEARIAELTARALAALSTVDLCGGAARALAELATAATQRAV
ncbi:MAG TPA: polyprenyl synthetase family protein [Rugosimonospora sp.]|nr:polyprenyl synthetase family protein [Rugosimonospora sp.]